jgi:hypothetical protein
LWLWNNVKFDWPTILTIVSILLGIPTFVGLFVSAAYIQGALVLALILVLVYLGFIFKAPAVKIKKTAKHLIINNKQGTNAQISGRHDICVNHNGVSEFWINGIGATGTVEDIRLDRMRPSLVEPTLGTVRVCKRFPTELRRGETLSVEFSWSVKDSFPADTESLIHSVDYKTRALLMTVKLPAARKCITARAYTAINHHPQKILEQPQVSLDRRTITLDVSRPKQGLQYVIEWDW